MQRFTATIQQFAEQGEKTGWTYIEVPVDIIEKINPGPGRLSFRIKGKLDAFPVKGLALLPMKGGNFIMPLNAEIRKGIKKKKGAMLDVQIAYDPAPVPVPAGLMECLDDEPEAKKYFDELRLSQRNYFLKWIAGVKGEAAVAKRIAQAITAFSNQQDFGSMIRGHKADREKRGY